VALCGKGELAEIMVLCAEIEPIDIVGLIELVEHQAVTGGYRLLATSGVEAAINTDQRDPQGTYDRMAAVMPDERTIVPPS
jgi:hypothetical protein